MAAPHGNVLFAVIVIILIVPNLHTTIATPTKSTSLKTYKAYIRNACNSTTYPSVCYKSLSNFASNIKTNPRRLVITSVSVALKAAQNVSSAMSKLSTQKGLRNVEVKILSDCVENIQDTVSELQQSMDGLKHLGGPYVQDQLKDIRTWMSAARTDEDTCTDDFDGQKVSKAFKKNVTGVVAVITALTSNALSLLNRLVVN